MSTALALLPGASGLSNSEKTSLKAWYNKVAGSTALARAKMHAVATATAVRQSGEGAVVGAALGALSVHLPGGLDFKGVPIDGIGGAIATLAGIALASEPVAPDLLNMGAAGITICSFRKMQEVAFKHKASHGGIPALAAHGEFGSEDDDIVAFARNMTP